jgi:hypothetical protein
MNKQRMYISCFVNKIKKYFSKSENNEINHACEKLKEMTEDASSIEELKLTEEYALNYNTTTRWQTL